MRAGIGAGRVDGVPRSLQLLLFLHVLGAIVVVRADVHLSAHRESGRDRPRSTATSRAVLSEPIERRIVIPGAIVQGITGLLLIL